MLTASALSVVETLPARRAALFVCTAALGAKASTRRERAKDLRQLAQWLRVVDAESAIRQLVERGPRYSREVVLAWRAAMVDAWLSPATINRRLSTVRAVIAGLRDSDAIAWSLAGVKGLASASYRDTAGPRIDGVRAMLGAARARHDAKGARDRAILRLLFDLALRRGEVVALDVEHLDLEAARLAVLGKGRFERETVTLPAETCAALVEWLRHRGTAPGALFVSIDRHGNAGERLDGSAVYLIVRALGAAVHVATRPHGIRHAAITSLLDETHGDVRGAAGFSRHADLGTLTRYDDNRRDGAGRSAALVASLLGA